MKENPTIDVVLFGDCIDKMRECIRDKSVDMILCDLPYGTTVCKWDTVIPFGLLWEQYKRIIKENGAIVLTAAQPFTSALVMSNIEMFKYCYSWKKSKAQHFAQAPYRPMTIHEDIVVFSYAGTSKNAKNRLKYNPQNLLPFNKVVPGKPAKHSAHRICRKDQDDYLQKHTNYPNTFLEFSNEGRTVHPTQKPVSLFEYLIKTYTDEGDTVLDNCAGSGTTGVACKNLNRHYILIEKELEYVDIIKERLSKMGRPKTRKKLLGKVVS